MDGRPQERQPNRKSRTRLHSNRQCQVLPPLRRQLSPALCAQPVTEQPCQPEVVCTTADRERPAAAAVAFAQCCCSFAEGRLQHLAVCTAQHSAPCCVSGFRSDPNQAGSLTTARRGPASEGDRRVQHPAPIRCHVVPSHILLQSGVMLCPHTHPGHLLSNRPCTVQQPPVAGQAVRPCPLSPEEQIKPSVAVQTNRVWQ